MSEQVPGGQDMTPSENTTTPGRSRSWIPTTRRGWWIAAGAALGVLALIIAGTWALARATAPEDPAASPTPTTSAPAGDGTCTAQVIVRSTWDDGYNADVIVAAGDGGLTSWDVAIDLGESSVTETWNSTLATGATGLASASNVQFNGTVEPGGSATFGFNAQGEPSTAGASCSGASASAVSPEPTGEATADAPPPSAEVQDPSNAPSGDDWLSVEGNTIVDANGNVVWLTGANWFGFNTSERVFHGLWQVNLEETIASIAGRGINVLRVPISTELLLEWRAGNAQTTGNVNAAANPDLEGATTLEIFDAFLVSAKAHGLKVILDLHSALADNAGHITPVWYAGDVSAEDFFVAWEWVAQRYREDDTIIGFDLKNEPHGKAPETPRATWGGGGENDWQAVASEAAQRIHAVHPDALLLVEGIEATPKSGQSWTSNDPDDYDITWWGGNLRLAGDLPVEGPEDKILYSPHDYGPLVYDQPWFQGSFSAASLEEDVWGPNWLYLHDEGISPLLIGEWGGRLGQDDRQDQWMTYLRDLIGDRHLHHTFWCINPNSGDTGGLLNDDWTTWDETKYALVREVLWQDDSGAFVGLDHEVALPNGITVTEYYANGGDAPTG
ncbi:cellulase family glycosylhydrolase [Demequina sp.]|uniref:cellulase family glycosylhydrolase n=1 Tax=Demequina sp. TaxID=2050685 RepID=UPI003A84925C